MEVTIGTRIYYTGDQANGSSAGTVIEIIPATKYGPEEAVIMYDEERFEGDTRRGRVPVYLLNDMSTSKRFFLEQVWHEIQERAQAEFIARYSARNS